MKLVTICTFACASIHPTLTYADSFYIGTDFSHMKMAQSEFDAAGVNNILAGYEFKHLAIEGSYNMSHTHNEFYGGDQDINMYHLYGVYRSQGSIFYKVKLGLTNERYRFYNGDGGLELGDVHLGIARGIGIGYRFDQLYVELEYSWLGASLETLGIGARYYLD